MAGKILVLDDEEKYAQMLKDLLADNGFEAETSTRPEEALRRLESENYALVVTDYKMPVMDGAEFLKAARRTNPDLPVIIISGLMNLPELLKVANMGVTLVLEKPFDAEDFLAQVGRFVKREEAASESAAYRDAQSAPEGTALLAYPKPTAHLADASIENQRLLGQLHAGLEKAQHSFVSGQVDTEFRLLTQELQEWLGQDPKTEVPCIDVRECEGELLREWLAEVDPAPALLVIEIRHPVFDHEHYTLLRDWFAFISRSKLVEGGTKFLYVYSGNWRPEAERMLGGGGETFGGVEILTAGLLPLTRRIEDAAWYLRKALDGMALQIVEPEAAALLLEQDWSAGIAELWAVAEGLARVSLGGQVKFRDVRQVLMERGRMLEVADIATLESYLCKRQREYIQRHQEKGEDWKTTLMRLGYTNMEGILDLELELGQQKLLCPQVLEAAEADSLA